jgi:hypothetical protein
MQLVRTEQLKLSAAYLNGLAIAFLAVGGIGPLLAFAAQSVSGNDFLSIGIIAFGCVCISGALHLFARLSLEGLKDD